MLHYRMTLKDVLRLTPEQEEFLFAGLLWWGAIRMVRQETEEARWAALRRMIPGG